MPLLETPPDPAQPPPSPPSATSPERDRPLRGRRLDELEHHELIYLLDQLDDERSRSRFREAIYISLLFYCVLAFVVLYGPRYLWHTPQIIPVQTEKEQPHMTYLETPPDLQKVLPKHPPPVISDRPHTAQTPHPVPRTPTPEELQAMRRAGEPRPAARPAPQPPAPQPQPRAAQPQPQPQPQPAQPQPQPQPRPAAPAPPPSRPQPSNIPDAPKPNPTQNASRPSFNLPSQSPSQMAAEAARGGRGLSGGEGGLGAPVAHNGAAADAEILSDTLGVDFGPYIRRLLVILRAAWIPLIPEECQPPLSKEGQTLIRFTIAPNGKLTFMGLDDSTHDGAIDRAAWGAVKSVGQYPPLPKDFKGPELTLRVNFIISHNPEGGRRTR